MGQTFRLRIFVAPSKGIGVPTELGITVLIVVALDRLKYKARVANVALK